MRYKRLQLTVVLLFGLGLIVLQAQEIVNTTGDNASGSGGSSSYTVGQIVYTTQTGTTGNTIAHGMQQPYEISVVTGIEETTINLIVTAYPNPTTNFLILKVDASITLSISSLSYQLYDLQGKLLQNKKVEDNETSIVMSNFVPATYFVRIIQGNKEVKRFKIIKN